MASASEGKTRKKDRPGPEPERLVIREEDAEEALDRFLGKNATRPADDEGEGEKKPEDSEQG